jgi:hypothetical protein
MKVSQLVALSAICLTLFASSAHAQDSRLNGVYGSQGSGTVNGESVTEVSVWAFNNGILIKLIEVINFPTSGGGAFGCTLEPNQSGALPYMLLGPNGQLQVPPSLADNRVHMVSFGCPGASGNFFSQAYLIIPENNGTEFSYLDADGEQGVFQLAGHAVKR